jgi:hypothetical protein
MDDLVDQRDKMIYKWTLEGTNSGPGRNRQPRMNQWVRKRMRAAKTTR